jgi:hypothetical protein
MLMTARGMLVMARDVLVMARWMLVMVRWMLVMARGMLLMARDVLGAVGGHYSAGIALDGVGGTRDSAVRVHNGAICAHDAWYVLVDTQGAHDGAACAHYGALSARDGASRAHDGAADSHDGACDAEKALGAGAAVVAIKVGGEALAAARR